MQIFFFFLHNQEQENSHLWFVKCILSPSAQLMVNNIRSWFCLLGMQFSYEIEFYFSNFCLALWRSLVAWIASEIAVSDFVLFVTHPKLEGKLLHLISNLPSQYLHYFSPLSLFIEKFDTLLLRNIFLSRFSICLTLNHFIMSSICGQVHAG